jgi:hypothetical protein
MNSIPSPIKLDEVQVRAARPEEEARVARELAGRHYLGAAVKVGHGLVQVAETKERWVALLVWGASAMRLNGRVEWIGWDARTRACRLKLVVNQHRFAVLVDGVNNLASRVLSLSAKSVADQWEERHGYRPLLAETFVDVERFAGTCYRAAGWQELGMTAGNRRSADYYVPNESPKQLWVKELVGGARQRLGAPEVAAAQQGGLNPGPVGVLPLRQPELASLHEALRAVPDPRRSNRRHRASTVLTIVSLGLLMGQKRVMDFVRLATQLNYRQRELLWYYKAPGKKVGVAPGKDVFYVLLRAIDPNALAAVLNGWLAAQRGKLPLNLALDGKVVGDRLAQIVSLVDSESGATVAQALMSDATGGESMAGRRLIGTQELDGSVVSADAGHANLETPRTIVEAGADYVLQIKGNTPAVKKSLQSLVERRSPFLPRPASATGESRPGK